MVVMRGLCIVVVVAACGIPEELHECMEVETASARPLAIVETITQMPAAIADASRATFALEAPFLPVTVTADSSIFEITTADDITIHAPTAGSASLQVMSEALCEDEDGEQRTYPNTTSIRIDAFTVDRVVAKPECDPGFEDLPPPYYVRSGIDYTVLADAYHGATFLAGVLDDPARLIRGPGNLTTNRCVNSACIFVRSPATGSQQYFSKLDDSLVLDVNVYDPAALELVGLTGPPTFEFHTRVRDRLDVTADLLVAGVPPCRTFFGDELVVATTETPDICTISPNMGDDFVTTPTGRRVTLHGRATGTCRINVVRGDTVATYETAMKVLNTKKSGGFFSCATAPDGSWLVPVVVLLGLTLRRSRGRDRCASTRRALRPHATASLPSPRPSSSTSRRSRS